MNIQEKEVCEINSTALTEATISNGILRNVAIMSTNLSKNNRKYSQKAMEQITGYLDGCKCFVDHPSEKTLASGVRSVRDLCGVFSNGRKQGNKIIADLKIGKRFLGLFTDILSLGQAGMSINSKVKAYQPKDSDLEEIVECVKLTSVDVVSSPAMVNSLQESEQNKSDKTNSNLQEAVDEFLGVKPKATEQEIDEFIRKVNGGIR